MVSIKDVSTKSSYGFGIPKVHFTSIILDGGTDIPKSIDNPHIAHSWETKAASSVIDVNDEKSMSADLTLIIKQPYDVSDSLSFLFKEDFVKYLKIKVIQSTNAVITDTISDSPRDWLKKGGLLDASINAVVTPLDQNDKDEMPGQSTGFKKPPQKPSGKKKPTKPGEPTEMLDAQSSLDTFLNQAGLNFQVISIKDFVGSSGLKTSIGINANPATTTAFESGGMVEQIKDIGFEKEVDSHGNVVLNIPYRLKFHVPPQQGGIKPSHLSYFAYAYIDLDDIETDSILGSLNLSDTLMSNLTLGTVTTEQVIRNGSTNTFGEIYYFNATEDNAGEVWHGPVHYHGPENPGPNGYIGYMAGTGGNDMGPELVRVTVPNGTLQDFREVVEVEKLIYDYSKFSNYWTGDELLINLLENSKSTSMISNDKTPVFSELETSVDGSGNTRFFFSLNVQEAIRKNTMYPNLVDMLMNKSPDIKQSFLKSATIREMRIFRQRVEEKNIEKSKNAAEILPNSDPVMVVRSYDPYFPNKGYPRLKANKKYELEDPTQKIVGTLREIDFNYSYHIFNQGSIRHFSGVDVKDVYDGTYKYFVEIDMNDPINTWLEERLREFNTVLYGTPGTYSPFGKIAGKPGLKDYVDDTLSSPKNYNTLTNRFTTAFATSMIDKYKINFVGVKLLEFFNILEQFGVNIDTTKLQNMYAFMSTIAGPKFGNPSGALKVLNIMKQTLQSLTKLLTGSKTSTLGRNSKATDSVSGSPVNNKVKADYFKFVHTFGSLVNYETDHRNGYDYLSQNNTKQEDSKLSSLPGLKTIGLPQFQKRTADETKKYFISEDASIVIEDSQVVYNPNDSILKNKYSFLSPSVVNVVGRSKYGEVMNSNGQIRTDVKELNNLLLDIIKLKKMNKRSEILPKNQKGLKLTISDDNYKLRGDLLQLLSERGCTVSSLELVESNNETVTATGKNAKLSDNLGLSNSTETAQVSNLNPVNIDNTNIDPNLLLMTVTHQHEVDFIDDNTNKMSFYDINSAAGGISFKLSYGLWYLAKSQNPINATKDAPLTSAPNQLKSFILALKGSDSVQKNPYYSLMSAGDTTDFQASIETPANFSFYWFNIKNLVRVEVLRGYAANITVNQGNTSKTVTNLKSPIWSALEPTDLTPTLPGQSTKLLCRLVPYENQPIGIKRYEELEMPIYNDHFFIDLGVVASTQIGGAQETSEVLRTSTPTLQDLQDANMRTGQLATARSNSPGDLFQRNTGTPLGEARVVVNTQSGNSRFTQAQVQSTQSQRTEDKLGNLIVGAAFMEGNNTKAEDIKTESVRNGATATSGPAAAPSGQQQPLAAGGSVPRARVPGGSSGY